jgi:hypothetical protein
MALRPDFFAWPFAERERFAAHLSRADRAALERVLLKELFGITAGTDHEVVRAIDELDLDQCNVINSTELDAFTAISWLCGPANYDEPPRAPKPTSGLIEQQRLFRALRRP